MSSPLQIPVGRGVPGLASSTSSTSTWDRISNWASEHKAVVYTIAGVAIVVTGAGVAYYLTDTVGSPGLRRDLLWYAFVANRYRADNDRNRTRYAKEIK